MAQHRAQEPECSRCTKDYLRGAASRRVRRSAVAKVIARKKNHSRGGLVFTRRAGDAVPGSQGSITGGIRNLQIGDILAPQLDHVDRPSVTMPISRRPTQQGPRHQRAFHRCAQRAADPHAYTGNSDSGLMGHMSQKHRSQPLIQESVAQLRQLDRAACVICGTIRSRCVGGVVQDRRQPGHQDATTSWPTLHSNPVVGSQPISQGDIQN